MKRIHYAGDTELTGDDIADAVVLYAEALANSDMSAAVAIPVRREDGRVDQVSFLIGPASQMTAAPEDSEFDELVDEELVRDMKDRIRNLSPAPASLDIQYSADVVPDLDLPDM
jgi:hypothetical protein